MDPAPTPTPPAPETTVRPVLPNPNESYPILGRSSTIKIDPFPTTVKPCSPSQVRRSLHGGKKEKRKGKRREVDEVEDDADSGYCTSSWRSSNLSEGGDGRNSAKKRPHSDSRRGQTHQIHAAINTDKPHRSRQITPADVRASPTALFLAMKNLSGSVSKKEARKVQEKLISRNQMKNPPPPRPKIRHFSSQQEADSTAWIEITFKIFPPEAPEVFVRKVWGFPIYEVEDRRKVRQRIEMTRWKCWVGGVVRRVGGVETFMHVRVRGAEGSESELEMHIMRLVGKYADKGCVEVLGDKEGF